MMVVSDQSAMDRDAGDFTILGARVGGSVAEHWLCMNVSLRNVAHRIVNPVTPLAFVHLTEGALAAIPSCFIEPHDDYKTVSWRLLIDSASSS